jgi:hypothetical protein
MHSQPTFSAQLIGPHTPVARHTMQLDGKSPMIRSGVAGDSAGWGPAICFTTSASKLVETCSVQDVGVQCMQECAVRRSVDTKPLFV